jgi:hypothetical protein
MKMFQRLKRLNELKRLLIVYCLWFVVYFSDKLNIIQLSTNYKRPIEPFKLTEPIEPTKPTS